MLSILDEWQELSCLIARARQPTVAYPLAIHCPDPTKIKNPFRTACYISEATCSAQQMVHLAFLLLDLAKPCADRCVRVSSLTDGEECITSIIQLIISISVANRRIVAWVNAVQALHTAGLALVGWKYRKALLHFLVDIGLETGWNTKHAVAALLKWWG